MSQAQIVEARTKAEVQRIEAQTRAENQRMEAQSAAEAKRLAAHSSAEAQRIQTEAEIHALREKEQAAQAYTNHPALLRLAELETLQALGRSATARIYVGFGQPLRLGAKANPTAGSDRDDA